MAAGRDRGPRGGQRWAPRRMRRRSGRGGSWHCSLLGPDRRARLTPAPSKPRGRRALGHLGHMLSYAAQPESPHGPSGIASYPWGWLVDFKPIVYLNIDPSKPALD